MAVHYTEELLSRVEAWLSNSDSKRRTRENLQELHALYAAITGQPISSCVSCGFSAYVGILQAYQTQATRFFNPQLMANAQYTIAPGFENETFVHESFTSAITAENLTDKAAEFFINNGFRHAFLKGGKPIPEEKQAEAEQPSKPKTKADWQARYKEVLGEDADTALTIAQLEEAITAYQAEQEAARD